MDTTTHEGLKRVLDQATENVRLLDRAAITHEGREPQMRAIHQKRNQWEARRAAAATLLRPIGVIIGLSIDGTEHTF